MEDTSVSSASTCSDYVSFESSGSHQCYQGKQPMSENEVRQSSSIIQNSNQDSRCNISSKSEEGSRKVKRSASSMKGTKQSESFDNNYLQQNSAANEAPLRDIVFLILFIAQLALVLLITVKSGRFIYDVDGSYSKGVYIMMDFKSVMLTLMTAFMFASVLAVSSLSVLLKKTSLLLNAAMAYSIVLSIAAVIFGFEQKSVLICTIGAAYMLYSIFLCSRRSPIFEFTSTNIRVALVAIQNHYSLLVVAATSTMVLFGWSFVWSLAAVGLINESATNCNDGICEGGVDDVLKGKPLMYSILLIISFFWTQQVIKNILHTCVAGAIGVWWFEENCSPSHLQSDSWRIETVRKTLILCFTRLFGSICAGSILVAIFQSLRVSYDNIYSPSVEKVRKNSHEPDKQYLEPHYCQDCVGSFLHSIHEWAYTFVALYGFSYFQAGKAVSKLFHARGWTTVISDNILGRVIFMVNTFVALSTGLLCLVLAVISPSVFPVMEKNAAATAGLTIGIIAGYVTSSIILNVSTSAVQAILVCFAESPHQLRIHYPDLSSEIKACIRDESYMTEHSNFECTVEFSKMSDTNNSSIQHKVLNEV